MRIIIVAVIAELLMIYLAAIVLPANASTPYPGAPNESDTSPASIDLRPEISHVMANGFDNIQLTAYVYDAQGNPVPDGTQVNFTVGNALNNAYTGGFTWSLDNGSFSDTPGSGMFTNVTCGGSAIVRFGWVPQEFGGNNSTIWAYINGTSIHSAIKIYLSSSYGAWTGRVVDSSGVGLGGIPVTLHIIGWDNINKSYYEIFNMTTTTSSSPSSVGRFAFYYMSSQDAIGYYVDAEARLGDNLTIHGKSRNFSMNRSDTSIGAIVLEAPPKVTITTSLSTAAKPIPSFEIIFALAGLLSAAYLIVRKD